MKRKILYFILILIIIVLAAASYFVLNIKYEGAVAEIYSDGELVKTIELDRIAEGYELVVESEEGENTLRVEQGRICVVSASCPDKICVNQGWISDGVMPIVCLPNKLTVKIRGTDDQADTAAK